MTNARDTSPNGPSTASYTARSPVVLCKSKTRWRKSCQNLWQAAHIVGKAAKPVVNPSTQAPQTYPDKSDIKPSPNSNPHRRS